MSTRAIIAVPTAKGYRTAWVWNDAFPNDLGKKLKTKFNTEQLVKELISYVSFGSVVTKKEKEDYEKSFADDMKNSNAFGYFKELSNGLFLHIYPHNGKPVVGSGRYAFIKTIDEMLGQDLDYVYVFNNGEWETYK